MFINTDDNFKCDSKPQARKSVKPKNEAHEDPIPGEDPEVTVLVDENPEKTKISTAKP